MATHYEVQVRFNYVDADAGLQGNHLFEKSEVSKLKEADVAQTLDDGKRLGDATRAEERFIAT